MMVVRLDEISQLSGLFGLITVMIAIFWGCIVLYRAIKSKEKILYFFFLAVIFTMSPWSSSGFGYLFWLITGEVFNYYAYILIGTLGIPIALISWLKIYFKTLHTDKSKIVLSLITFISIFYYIYLIYFLFLASNAPIKELIGIQPKPNDMEYKGFILIYMAMAVLLSTITGIDFSLTSIKIKENPIVQWKGRFLLISFICFAIGALGDAAFVFNQITLITFRIFLIISSTLYYIGFIMPKWMKKFLSLK